MAKLISFTKKIDEPITVALGLFDCVHEGHRKLLASAKGLSKVLNAKLCVFTFSNNPAALFNRDEKLVNTFPERVGLLEQAGANYILYTAFDEEFSQKAADVFLSDLLKSDIRGIVCGFDYRFGFNAEGDVGTLARFCNANGIAFQYQPQVVYKNRKLSTSLVKEYLANGDLRSAFECLGRNYFMDGYVTAGRGKGKGLGFPTANIETEPDKFLPKQGVYAGTAEVECSIKKCVINVGARPTFNDDEVIVEAHIIDFEGDIYFQKLRLTFNTYLRPIEKFGTELELVTQMGRDVERARK